MGTLFFRFLAIYSYEKLANIIIKICQSRFKICQIKINPERIAKDLKFRQSGKIWLNLFTLQINNLCIGTLPM